MREHSSDGQHVFPSRERLAAYAKLSTKTVHRLLYGYVDKRSGKRHRGLCERGIVSELAKPRRFRNSAKYRINVDALSADPRVTPHLERDRERAAQMKLPGIVKSPKPGIPQQPISDMPSPMGHSVQCTWDTVSDDHGTRCPLDPKASIDPKAFDPGALAKALIEAIQQTPYELPATPGNVSAITEALKAVITGGKSPPDAFEYLLGVTRDGIERGRVINRWWFEDAKWKQALKGPIKRDCDKHPNAGFTDWGECWGCYGERYRSGCAPA